MQQQIETTLKRKFPEIERIFSRTSIAEITSDLMPRNIFDGYIMVKMEPKWPRPKRFRETLLAPTQKVANDIPGNNNNEFSQPIQLRFNELISGLRRDVAVKRFGDDMTVLNDTADQVSPLLGKISGAAELKIEQTSGLAKADLTYRSRQDLAIASMWLTRRMWWLWRSSARKSALSFRAIVSSIL